MNIDFNSLLWLQRKISQFHFARKLLSLKGLKASEKNQREKFTRDKKSPTPENMEARVIKINEVKSQISKCLKTLPTSKLTIISHSRSVD